MIKVTIKGPSGSGKSTVAKILYEALKDKAASGEIQDHTVYWLEDDMPFYETNLAEVKENLTGKHDVLIKVKNR